MAILESDLKLYLPANLPVDDTTTMGGAISLTRRPLDAQFSAAARPEIDSSNAADTMNVTIDGRNAAGEPIQEVKALNGTSAVLFDDTFERILQITIASTAAGTVTVAQGTGGTVRHTFAPGELIGAILFQNAASDPATGKVRYEKVFAKNAHGSLSLIDATIELDDDSEDLYHIAVGAVDGTTTAANRLTEPSGSPSWTNDDTPIAVPGDVLATGEAIEVWVRQTLATGNAPGKSSPTVTLAGNST